MKELKWKIIKWCFLPVIFGLAIIGIAAYNYSNPPLKIGNLTMSRLKFKLGVDLVGGTILVYEIDPDKKPENYSKEQLISALKRRLDPADLYNITIRPLSETRVEIILPTGGRHLLEAQTEAWNALLDAVHTEWPQVKREQLTAKRGDTAELTQQIRLIDSSISGDAIAALVKAKWGDASERSLTGDDVERIKELIQRVGSLEFRILANATDDADAIAKSKEYFTKVSDSWRSFVDAIKARYDEIKKGTKEDPLTADDIACGDEASLKELVKKRYPTTPSGEIDQVFAQNFNKKSVELIDMMKRSDTGVPPPLPVGPDGKRFKVTTLKGGVEPRVSYRWVELGKKELHTLGLNNDSKENPAWQSARRARSAGVMVDGTQVTLVDGTQTRLSAIYGVGDGKDSSVNSGGFTVPLFSRKITNPSRITPKDKVDGKEFEYFFLTRDAEQGKEITGEYLTSAREAADEAGGMAVGFNFNSRGGALFFDLTSANGPPQGERGNQRRYLAIVLDGQIESAPGLESPIRDSGIIKGHFTKQEIEDLVNILRSGALPATLKQQPVSENTMGATLGDDTIRSGTISVGIAFGAILLFMLLYYRFAGFVACIALLANLILTIAFMVMVNATFTLPGLAGLVLMLAMAVDANILIYERLREERDRGASLALALRNGYDRAFPTIIDTHLSSIFTAIVLYVVGNDQLKGFGISLTVGLLISLYTSLYMTKLMFRFWELKGWLKKLSMARLLSRPRIDFMRIRKPVFVITVTTALLGLGLFLARGKSSLNMDFVGGTVYSGVLKEMMNTEEIRSKVESAENKKALLALAKDPEPVGDPKDRRWRLVYEKPVDGISERVIRMTEDVTASDLRRRVEDLPEPSIELIYHSSDKLSSGDHSKLFTVRTTEKSPDIVSESIRRLLEGQLETVKLNEYLLRSLSVQFQKPVTLDQARATITAALLEKGVIKASSGVKDVAAIITLLKSKPLPAAALVEARKLIEGDAVVLVGKEQDPPGKETWKTLALSLKEPVEGKRLLDALAPLAADKQIAMTVQASEAELHLSDYAYLSQVKSQIDEAFQEDFKQGVTVKEVDRKDEQDDRYNRMTISLPSAVDGPGFRRAMDQFAQELPSRPLPIRLENFDSALAADMQQRAIYAIVASWGAILLYLWFRFGNWTFGLAAVLCLVHDVCMTLGFIAVSHYLYGWFGPVMGVRDFKLDLAAIASLLTLIGFSVNDTIVVFDRIREVRGKNPNLTPEMINDSINQTLSRTILTSLTAWMVVVVLFIWGGEGVHLFAFVMVVGVLLGTMSSIFVASPLLLYLGEGAARGQTAARPREEMTAPREG